MTLARFARINGVLVALVPMEPTEEMCKAARSLVCHPDPRAAGFIFSEMLQNAPAVEVPEGDAVWCARRKIEFLEELPE